MSDAAEDRIVHNLIEALEQLRRDLDRVELWAGALGYFQGPAPAYRPGDQYVLPPRSQAGSEKSQGAPVRPPL